MLKRKITTMTSFVCLGRALAVAAHRDTQPCEQGAQAHCPSPLWGLGRWAAVPAWCRWGCLGEERENENRGLLLSSSQLGRTNCFEEVRMKLKQRKMWFGH